jgi:hypothetical protein
MANFTCSQPFLSSDQNKSKKKELCCFSLQGSIDKWLTFIKIEYMYRYIPWKSVDIFFWLDNFKFAISQILNG